jgi:hypothetical protein
MNAAILTMARGEKVCPLFAAATTSGAGGRGTRRWPVVSAEIVRQQMARRLGDPIPQRRFLIGRPVEHADDLAFGFCAIGGCVQEARNWRPTSSMSSVGLRLDAVSRNSSFHRVAIDQHRHARRAARHGKAQSCKCLLNHM